MFQTLLNRFEPIMVVKDRHTDTVPDMSFTPREIISKFSRGERVPLGFKGLYDSEDDPENDKFDLDPQIFQEDPTRDPAFDFGDYVEEKHALQERQKEARRAQQRKTGTQSKREAKSEEVSASDPMRSETTSGDGAPAPNVQPKA